MFYASFRRCPMKVLILVALLLASCASMGTQVSKDSFSQIKRGETTKAQVVAMFGNPTTITLTDEGKESYVYHSFKLGFMGLSMDQQIVQVIFDQDDIVSKATTIDTKR
jgi:outer membrane protein assembly factor BamE (lipoprotein component of BamABCDE complex)